MVRRIKTLFRERDERSGSTRGLLLSLTRTRGIVPQADASNRIASAEDLSKYKVCRPGDLVMNRMQAWSGMFALSSHEGVVSPDYSVFEAIGVLKTKYFEHLFKTPVLVDQFAHRSKGIGSGFNRLYTPDFGAVPVVVPPLLDQSAITRFLGHADRKIRRYIWAKQKLINLLEEQKQIIIHRAVTLGLDPNVRLKPSGVEWLGNAPEHWEVRALARIAIEQADYRGATPSKTESGVFLVTAKNVRKGWIDYEVSREFVAEEEYAAIMRRGLPHLGDLLLTMEAPLGHAALVDRERVALAQRVVRFRFPANLVVPEFVLQSVLSPYFQNQLLRRGTGSTAQGIKASKLAQLQLLVPPLGEQRAIVERVRRECLALNRAAEHGRLEISLLRGYRTRLIADVVTGKLDVREVAATLPDEADEPAPLDDTAAVDTDEPVDDLDSAPEEDEA